MPGARLECRPLEPENPGSNPGRGTSTLSADRAAEESLRQHFFKLRSELPAVMRKLALLGVTLAIALAALRPCSSAPQAFAFAVQAVEPDGRPIADATVIVFSLRTIRAVRLGSTNASGWITGYAPPGDNYIIYVMKVKDGRLTRVPVCLDISDYANAESLTARVVLYPAARVLVTGKVIYIGGIPTGTARIMVLDREGRPVSASLNAGEASLTISNRQAKVSPQVVEVYGPARDYTFIKRGLGFEALKINEGLVPLGQPVRVRVEYGVLDMRTFTVKSLGVELGSRENPLLFTSTEQVEVVDLLKVSMEGQLQSLKADVAAARSQVDAYERMGFYIPEIHDLLRSGEEHLSAAERLYAQGEAPEKVIALMERVYAIANDQIPRRLGFLREIAKVGATVMPSFLAVFAAILAFYFFDSQRSKMISFSLLYAALVLAFAYVYPGFRLLWSLDRSLFLATVGGAYVAFFAIAFLLPRVIKEPELPGEVALGGLIAVAFTLGKRYSKVKATRTFITVFSIAAFIWAFTVLATFGAVYTKIEERGFARYAANVVVVKRVANETPQPLNAALDPLLFEGRSGVGNYSLAVMNRPDVSLRVAVSAAGREAIFRFAMGLDPRDLASQRATFAIATALLEEPSLVLPESAWRNLGLRGGEEVDVVFEVPGYGTAKLRMRAAGYFVESAFENLKDPDGAPLRPFVQRGGRTLYANVTEVVIVTPPQLLLSLFAPSEGGYSQVFYVYRIAAEVTEEAAGLSFINDVVDRRGESYVAISCYGGSCTRVYYGTRVQSVFEQEITFFVPLLIVIANVLLSMLSIVRERRREIFIFMCVGFNPKHIALVFLAEAIVYGLLSGGFGYMAGLTTFRLLSAFAAHQNLMVREKLEWYWSYLAIALAVAISILGAIKPSVDAAYLFVPTEVRKLKIAERREKVKRAEYVTRTAAAKTFAIPGEVMADEGEIAFSYIYSRLADLSYGELESVENLTDHPMEERPDGTRIKRFTFRYVSTTELGEKAAIDCELRFVLSPGADRYRIELDTKPVGQAPISHMDYAADLIKRVVSYWMTERERLLYSA